MTAANTDFHQVYLNLNIRGLPQSATIVINDLSNELQRQGREIFKLGLGQSPFPVPEPVVEALRQNAFQKDYLPAKGLRELRETIAEHQRENFHIDCSAEDVLIGPGSKELMFLIQLVYYGDLVIPTPTWVSYAPQAKIIGRHIHTLPTSMKNNWHLNPEQFDELCHKDLRRPRILILNYPSNPTGTTLSLKCLKELAVVARDHRVILLSDEIYGKLHHTGEHQSIVPLYPEGTVFSGGLSKWCGAGGWRLGFFVFPKSLAWLRDAIAAVATETFTSTSAPIQYAAIRAFQGGPEIDHYLTQARRVLRAIGQLLTQRLHEVGAELLPPDGGFYLFPDFSPFRDKLSAVGIQDSEQMCKRLLEATGVAILPGKAFGRPSHELTARIAYVDFNGADALTAAEASPADLPLDDAFVKDRCSRMVEAIDRLCEWITNPR